MKSSTSWQLVTYRLDGETRAGARRHDGAILAVDELRPYSGLLHALSDWDALEPVLRAWSPERGAPEPDATLEAPLLYPGKLICAGANYGTHLAEMGVDVDGRTEFSPYFFLLPASNTIVGHDAPVRIPGAYDAQVDWEAELAVVIGRRGRNIAAESAAHHVAGYTIVNDLSARATHHRDDAVGPPFEWDWLASKGLDDFCPMGPGVTPAWLIDNPHDLQVRLWVNDVLKQDTPTSDMLVGVWALVARASELMTLEPGDVIATGTPPGVGKPRGEFLAAGDRVDIEISALGRLTSTIETDTAGHD